MLSTETPTEFFATIEEILKNVQQKSPLKDNKQDWDSEPNRVLLNLNLEVMLHKTLVVFKVAYSQFLNKMLMNSRLTGLTLSARNLQYLSIQVMTY